VTGVKVWTGALLLCDYVKKNAERFADKCVLELGSGTGLAGIYASHFCGTPLVLTDGNDEILQLLQRNIDLNRTPHKEVKCCKLRWGHASDIDTLHHLAPNGFDIILGADIIYTTDSVEPLLDTVQQLLAPHGLFVLLYISRSSHVDNVLMKSATRRQLFLKRTYIQQNFEDAEALLCEVTKSNFVIRSCHPPTDQLTD